MQSSIELTAWRRRAGVSRRVTSRVKRQTFHFISFPTNRITSASLLTGHMGIGHWAEAQAGRQVGRKWTSTRTNDDELFVSNVVGVRGTQQQRQRTTPA